MADIRSSQNIAQVEWQDPGIQKILQTLAQIEWQDPGIMKMMQVVAQVEYDVTVNYDETLRLIDLTLTPSETDHLYEYETDLTVSLTATVSESGVFNKNDLDLLISVLTTASASDDLTQNEHLRLVNLISETSEQDFLNAVETPVISLSMSVLEANAQDFYDLTLIVSPAISVSVFDSVPMGESYRQIDLISSVSATDLLDAQESLKILLNIGVEGVSTMVFNPEVLTVPLTMTLSGTDLTQFIEDVEILLNMTIGENDGYAAVSRSLYTLLGRTKLYNLISRIKTYYLTKE